VSTHTPTRSSGSTRAVLIDKLGPPEVFVERDVPLPDPGPGEVHLRVDACGVNFADLMMRVGLYGTVPPRPFSPGFEVAATIARVGDGVEGWEPGDLVVGLLRHGGYARDVVVPADQIFRRPDGINAVAAAAIPVVFLTAWIALFEAARVDSRGDWEPDVRRVVGHRGLNVALDPVGGEATVACRRLLAPLGRLVFYGMSQALPGNRRNWIKAAKAWAKTPRIHPVQLTEPNQGIFGIHLLHLGPRSQEILMPAVEDIFRRVVEGELRPVIDTVFPLDRDGAVAAHTRIHSRANLGKIVLSTDA